MLKNNKLKLLEILLLERGFNIHLNVWKQQKTFDKLDRAMCKWILKKKKYRYANIRSIN